ncbi:MAG TPA: hypothetical protein VHY09_13285, partial [Candidatus Methylacidiphilales bacterium]|nr:hypothetical protein [Candidatus Methylacidiphilales bacterium]
QIEEFHQEEAQHHWEMRTGRAAVEADALVRLVEKSGGNFSAGMLAALGQEAFRQIASGSADPGVMSRIGTLFMKARSDDRADQMQQLKRRKMERELGDDAESSLEQLADLVQDHPAAREALDALRRELAANPEGPA